MARESDIAAHKILEALWIAFKNPAINRKEEQVTVIQDLAPFADLLGLHQEGASQKVAEDVARRESLIHPRLSPSVGHLAVSRLSR